jgi:excisionase family DNA binding protein
MSRLLLRVPAVAEMLSCSKTKTYSLLNSGAIRSVRIEGGARRVRVGAVEEYVARLEAEADKSAAA